VEGVGVEGMGSEWSCRPANSTHVLPPFLRQFYDCQSYTILNPLKLILSSFKFLISVLQNQIKSRIDYLYLLILVLFALKFD